MSNGLTHQDLKQIASGRLVERMMRFFSRPTRYETSEQVTDYAKGTVAAVVRNLPVNEPRAVIEEVCDQAYDLLIEEHSQHGWPLPATLLGYVSRARQNVCPVKREPAQDRDVYRPVVGNDQARVESKKNWTLEQAESALAECDAELARPDIGPEHAERAVALRKMAQAAYHRASKDEAA